MREIQISMREGSEQAFMPFKQKNTATNQNSSSNKTANERLSNSGQPIKTTKIERRDGNENV